MTRRKAHPPWCVREACDFYDDRRGSHAGPAQTVPDDPASDDRITVEITQGRDDAEPVLTIEDWRGVVHFARAAIEVDLTVAALVRDALTELLAELRLVTSLPK